MLVRVAEPGKAAFQLRPGEEGISVFDQEAVQPPLTETEILGCFRAGTHAVLRTRQEVEGKALRIVPIAGTEPLPQRLRDAHAEIRPSANMTRSQFKTTLKELE